MYVGGTFDLPHAGHVRFLKTCSRYGEVIVSLNTDEFAARYKRKPILSLKEREEILNEFESVSYTVVNEGDEDSKPAILKVKPRYIAHGDDWMDDGLMHQMSLTPEFLKENGILMLYISYTDWISTSEIIKRCASQS